MSALCDKILAMDKRIGFAMVANVDGEILESRMLGTPLMSKEAVAGFAGSWAAIIQGIALQMETYFGKSEIVSLGYEKLNVHGFKVQDRIVVITTRKDVPVEIVLGVKKTLQTQAA
jgi:hypothetical protein